MFLHAFEHLHEKRVFQVNFVKYLLFAAAFLHHEARLLPYVDVEQNTKI